MTIKQFNAVASEFGTEFAQRALNWFCAEFSAEFRAGVKDVVTFIRNNEYLIRYHVAS